MSEQTEFQFERDPTYANWESWFTKLDSDFAELLIEWKLDDTKSSKKFGGK